MKRIIRRIIAALAWGVIAERRQSELNEEHMLTRGYYVTDKHEIIITL